MNEPSKQLYIQTVGCQMNILDSEMVVASLRKEGYSLTQDPAIADAILFNTCSVREHAEEKAYNNVLRLKQLKLANPDLVIGVMGCMAQKDQQKVFDRVPFVDLVVGPGQLHKIPELIERAREFPPLFLRHHVITATDLRISRQPELHAYTPSRCIPSFVRLSRWSNIWPTFVARPLFWNHGLKEADLVLKPSG